MDMMMYVEAMALKKAVVEKAMDRILRSPCPWAMADLF